MEITNWFIRLFKQQKGHGFDPNRIKVEIDHYTAGDGQLEAKLGGEPPIIWPEGHQKDDVPPKELQTVNGFETWHCTVYGTENAIQTLQQKVFGTKEEYSERYIGVLAGITKGGGSPHEVGEAIRIYGQLPYNLLPNDAAKNWEEFNSPKPMTEELKNVGKEWTEDWDFKHDWVWNFSPDYIINLLKRYTLACGVYAWHQKDGVYTKPSWAKDNHWVQLCDYEYGKYWLVYDTYDQVFKRLDWNYPFAFMKRYALIKKKKDEVEAGKNLYLRFKNYKAVQVFPSGAVYTVGDVIKHEMWYAEKGGYLQDRVDFGLKADYKLGNIIPITQDQFDTMIKYANLAGIKIEEDKKVSGLINQLTK